MKRAGSPLAVLLLLTACGSPEPAAIRTRGQAIVGGQLALECQWASAVALGRCSGTLVHPRLVTTAAHCLTGQQPAEIVLGESASRPARTARIERCVLHPKYRTDPGHDLGFCTLVEPLLDVPVVPVLTACDALALLHDNRSVVIAGFGDVAVDQPGLGLKRWVEVTIEGLRSDGLEISVGTRVRGGCAGDSGGPAYVQLPNQGWRAFGALSRGGAVGSVAPAQRCSSTSLYTSLAAHSAWLRAESGVELRTCDTSSAAVHGASCSLSPLEPERHAAWSTACADQASAAHATPCEARTAECVSSMTDGGVAPAIRAACDVELAERQARVPRRPRQDDDSWQCNVPSSHGARSSLWLAGALVAFRVVARRRIRQRGRASSESFVATRGSV